jgi:flagellar basal-body rod protein FlgF
VIYGLWLSATGVMTNSHQVDVIANNLANAETSGFKRQLATFQERAPEAKEDHQRAGDRFFDNVGGGQLLSPSSFDTSAGVLEDTGEPLDLAINGEGYFLVRDAKGQERLTRNGNFIADREGNVVLATDSRVQLLGADRQPLKLDAGLTPSEIQIGKDGTISDGVQAFGRIGTFNIANEKLLRPVGGTLLKAPTSVEISPVASQIEAGYLERSNVDPALELTRLMGAQRMLDANANLIRYQDQSLSRLVNDVGRIA